MSPAHRIEPSRMSAPTVAPSVKSTSDRRRSTAARTAAVASISRCSGAPGACDTPPRHRRSATGRPGARAELGGGPPSSVDSCRSLTLGARALALACRRRDRDAVVRAENLGGIVGIDERLADDAELHVQSADRVDGELHGIRHPRIDGPPRRGDDRAGAGFALATILSPANDARARRSPSRSRPSRPRSRARRYRRACPTRRARRESRRESDRLPPRTPR